MGLFDSIVDAVKSKVAGDTQGNMMESVLGMLNDPQVGGLQGLVEKFSQGGLGEQVASWVSTGKNLPVSAEQLQSAMSSSGLQEIAAKFGFNTAEMGSQLSNLLPQVIDKLTPNGQVPEGGADLSKLAMSALSGLFGNKQA